MTEFETKMLEVLQDISTSLREIEIDLDVLGWDSGDNAAETSGLKLLTDIRNNTSE